MAQDIKSALFSASKQGRAEDIPEILATNVDVNLTDQLGNTPLHYAASANHANVVEILISNPKININAQNSYKDTPLHKAAVRGAIGSIKLLVSAGANLEIKNQDNQRPKDLSKSHEIGDLLVPPSTLGYDETPATADDDEEEDGEDYGEEDTGEVYEEEPLKQSAPPPRPPRSKK